MVNTNRATQTVTASSDVDIIRKEALGSIRHTSFLGRISKARVAKSRVIPPINRRASIKNISAVKLGSKHPRRACVFPRTINLVITVEYYTVNFGVAKLNTGCVHHRVSGSITKTDDSSLPWVLRFNVNPLETTDSPRASANPGLGFFPHTRIDINICPKSMVTVYKNIIIRRVCRFIILNSLRDGLIRSYSGSGTCSITTGSKVYKDVSGVGSTDDSSMKVGTIKRMRVACNGVSVEDAKLAVDLTIRPPTRGLQNTYVIVGSVSWTRLTKRSRAVKSSR